VSPYQVITKLMSPLRLLDYAVTDPRLTDPAFGGSVSPYVRLRVRTNSGVEVPIGQNTGCP
jgi:hypothetical protein